MDRPFFLLVQIPQVPWGIEYCKWAGNRGYSCYPESSHELYCILLRREWLNMALHILPAAVLSHAADSVLSGTMMGAVGMWVLVLRSRRFLLMGTLTVADDSYLGRDELSSQVEVFTFFCQCELMHTRSFPCL